MSDQGGWTIRSATEAAKGYVCDKLPEAMNNYDRRLWGLAPVLAAEVLFLRKKIAKLEGK